MPNFLTVVYIINDDEAFAPTRETIFNQFHLSDSEDTPFAVTAVSTDHEIHRADLMEQAAREIFDSFELHRALNAITEHPDIGNVKDLAEIIGDA